MTYRITGLRYGGIGMRGLQAPALTGHATGRWFARSRIGGNPVQEGATVRVGEGL